jgi:hypothetical protein
MVGVLVASATGVAWADDTRVRTTATVEVIDDKAQIDDVISRLRSQRVVDKSPGTTTPHAASLKLERPAPPSTAGDTAHRAVGPEPKEQRTGSRRSNVEHGNPDHTERPKLKAPHR